MDIQKYYDKTDLAKEVSEKLGTDKAETLRTIETVFETISERLAKSDSNPVVLDNIGTFRLRLRKGKAFKIEGRDGFYPDFLKVSFKAAKHFADTVHQNVHQDLKGLRVKWGENSRSPKFTARFF